MSAALIEFATVLFVKRRQDWTSNAGNSVNDQTQMATEIKDEGTSGVFKDTSKLFTTPTIKDESNGTNMATIRHRKSYWIVMFDEYLSLPLTTRIDVSTFLLFHIVYVMITLVHWCLMLS